MKSTMFRTVLFILILTGCSTEMTGWYEQADSGDTNGNADTDSDTDSDGDTDTETDTGTESETDSETETSSDTGDTESEWPTDSETDSETGTDSGTDTETDTGTDLVGDCIGPGVHWVASEAVCWELSPPTTMTTYTVADARCSSLVLDGASNWRVPDINELQMLIVGCATPGCGVYDPTCLDETCDDGCPTCSLYGGPGPGGCYWDASLGGECSSGGYWSSSLQSGVIYTSRWCVSFAHGSYLFVGGSVAYSRCIRTP